MINFSFNKIIAAFIVVGMLAAMVIAYQRNQIERANNTVEIMMDYNDLLKISQEDGVPVEIVARQFKTMGVTSLAVYDVTLEELARQNHVAMLSGEGMLAASKSITASPVLAVLEKAHLLNGGYTYIFDNNYSEFSSLQADLERRYGKKRVTALIVGEQKIICIAANYEDIEKKPIAISANQLREVSGYGFYVVARPYNYIHPSKTDVDAVFERLATIPHYKYSGVMFAGVDVLGYRSQIEYTAEKIKEFHLPLYVCESPLQLQFMKQEGLADIVRLTGYNAARAYVIIKEEQPKLQMNTMVHRFQIAALERNVRIAFLRRIEKPLPDMNLLQTNLRYVNDVRAELQERDFSIGKADIYKPYFPANLLLALVALGAVAATVVLFSQLFAMKSRIQYLLFIVAGAALFIPILHNSAVLPRQVAALCAAIVFPVLAGAWAVFKLETYLYTGKAWYRVMIDGVGAIVSIAVAALIGGIYIGAVLGDIRFILEADIFRGVKVAFILPPILIAMIYLRNYNLLENRANDKCDTLKKQVVEVWQYPLYVKTLVLLAIGAVIAWVLVGRSGDASGVPVPAIELKMRYWLEAIWYARPRTKEFLIGYPAFFVLLFAFWQKWPEWLKLVLTMAVVVGLGSAVETFCHLRSAIFLSTMRAFDGIVLGVLIGVALFVILCVSRVIYYRIKERA